MNQYNGSWDFTGPKPVGGSEEEENMSISKKDGLDHF
jgi:hypothetical protein